jgi:hypothetical protein
VKFGFVAKHRGIWPAEWLCGALGNDTAAYGCATELSTLPQYACHWA